MKTTKKRIKVLLMTLVLIFTMIPASVFADESQIRVDVNIFVNEKLKATDTVYHEDAGIYELEYGSFPFGWLYGDAYGTYVSGSAKMNGSAAYYFCFDGENASIFGSSFNSPMPGDVIELNLYYSAAEEEAPVVYGSAVLRVSDGRNPVEGAEAVFTGRKGADTVSYTTVSGADGTASIDGLDVSYSWTYVIGDLTYAVSFDGNNFYTSDHVVKVAEEEPAPEELAPEEPKEEIKEVKYTDPEFADEEYTITVYHDLSNAPGGTAVDGHVEGALEINGKTVVMHPGEEGLMGGELFAAVNGEFTVKENGNIVYGGDEYQAGGWYISGGSQDPSIGSVTGMSKGEAFTMIRSDITIVLHYTLVKPEYTVTMNYVDENGEVLADQEIRSFEGSTAAEGEKSYDITGFAPGFYAGYKMVDGYTYNRAEGDSLTGEMDSDKVVNFIYTVDKVPEEITEEPEVPVVPEEPEVPEVPEDPEVPEEPTPEPEDEIIDEEPEKTPEEPEEEPKDEIIPEPEQVTPSIVPVPETSDEPEEPEETQPEDTQTASADEDDKEEPVEIEEEEVPLADMDGKAWALVNLISTIFTVLMTMFMLLTLRNKKEEDDDEEDDEEESEDEDRKDGKKARKAISVASILPAAAAVIAFIFTEDMRNPMALTDKWTIAMIAILIADILLLIIRGKRKEMEEETNKAEA